VKIPSAWAGPACEACKRPTATRAAWDDGKRAGCDQRLCWKTFPRDCYRLPFDWEAEGAAWRAAAGPVAP
jgi:hypothetical protein